MPDRKVWREAPPHASRTVQLGGHLLHRSDRLEQQGGLGEALDLVPFAVAATAALTRRCPDADNRSDFVGGESCRDPHDEPHDGCSAVRAAGDRYPVGVAMVGCGTRMAKQLGSATVKPAGDLAVHLVSEEHAMGGLERSLRHYREPDRGDL